MSAADEQLIADIESAKAEFNRRLDALRAEWEAAEQADRYKLG